MSEPQNREENRARKSKIYFAIAGAFLLLMGLVWSLDSFFVYITLGSSIFFFFLAFRNRRVAPVEQRRYYDRPRPQTNPNPQTQPGPAQPNSSSQTSSAFNALWEALKQNASKQSGPAPSNQSKATVIVTLGFIFFVFTIIIVSVIFSDSTSIDYGADYYYQTGENFLWEHQYDSAKIYYRRALSIEPEYAEALNGYGNALMGLNNYDSALIMMNKALDVNPDYDYAMYSKALVYFYKQNYKQSRRELFSLMENTPDYYDAMVLTGDDYYVEQRNDSAFYWYQKAYDNGVRSAGLSRVLAEIHDSKSNRDKAIDLYKESLSYDSTNTGIYDRLSELLPNRDGEVFRKASKRWKEAGY
jgi:tetratricopeptide (TPR) repeat protein